MPLGLPDVLTGVLHSWRLNKSMPNSRHVMFTMASHFLLLGILKSLFFLSFNSSSLYPFLFSVKPSFLSMIYLWNLYYILKSCIMFLTSVSALCIFFIFHFRMAWFVGRRNCKSSRRALYVSTEEGWNERISQKMIVKLWMQRKISFILHSIR